MSSMAVVGIYVALNLLMLIWFSFNVGTGRMSNKISLGDGGNEDMTRKIRAQGNFIEYAPLAMIGLFMLALLGAPILLLHLLGGVFVLSRLCHFLELGLNMFSKGRLIGTLGTMLTLLITALSILFLAITGA